MDVEKLVVASEASGIAGSNRGGLTAGGVVGATNGFGRASEGVREASGALRGFPGCLCSQPMEAIAAGRSPSSAWPISIRRSMLTRAALHRACSRVFWSPPEAGLAVGGLVAGVVEDRGHQAPLGVRLAGPEEEPAAGGLEEHPGRRLLGAVRLDVSVHGIHHLILSSAGCRRRRALARTPGGTSWLAGPAGAATGPGSAPPRP